MPRKKLVRDGRYPYHVTARTNNREWYYLPMEKVWDIFGRISSNISSTYGARIHALVLMSNHFHLLLTTPEANLGEAMNQFQREISRSINRTADTINHVFGGPYKWSLIQEPLYFQHALKYVYRNPVKAGIAPVVEGYPYSTFPYLLRNKALPFPIAPSVFDDRGIGSLTPLAQLDWLNLKYTDKEDDCIRRALRHRLFQMTPDRKTRKIPPLFTQSKAVPSGKRTGPPNRRADQEPPT